MQKKLIPARAVLAFLNALEASQANMHGFLFMREGEIAAEGYWKPFHKDHPHRMYSVSKSMTALAIGMLLGDGYLKLDDHIASYFPEHLSDPTPEQIKRMTIRHMLKMATAHSSTTYKRKQDDNWTRTFFTVPPDHEPGMVFSYDTSASHTLAALVEKLTGQPLDVFLKRRLFDPLKCSGEMRWMKDPVGVCQGGSGLVLTLRDLGLVAACCLRGGDGYVPEDFLKEATQKQIDTPLQPIYDEQFGYGYQFWRTRENGYAMFGMGGQLAICLPDYDLAVCTMADTQQDHAGVQKIHDALFHFALPLIIEGGDDTDAQEELDRRLQHLAIPAVANQPTYENWPALAYVYQLEQNPAGITHLKVENGRIRFVDTLGEHDLPFGIGTMEHGAFPGTREPCIASAGWIAPGTMHLVCHVIGDEPGVMELLLAVDGFRVTMKVRSTRNAMLQPYDGFFSGTKA